MEDEEPADGEMMVWFTEMEGRREGRERGRGVWKWRVTGMVKLGDSEELR